MRDHRAPPGRTLTSRATRRVTQPHSSRRTDMCKLCDEGKPQDHTGPLRDSRRDFLKVAATTGVAAAALNLFAARPAAASLAKEDPPSDSGKPGRRYIIRGGSVMSMDPTVGDFPKGD